jgi:hypothetical protein
MARENVYRLANDTIAARARELRIDGPVPFICECEHDRCFELVRVPLGDYDERTRSGPLLHRRHRHSLATAA